MKWQLLRHPEEPLGDEGSRQLTAIRAMGTGFFPLTNKLVRGQNDIIIAIGLLLVICFLSGCAIVRDQDAVNDLRSQLNQKTDEMAHLEARVAALDGQIDVRDKEIDALTVENTVLKQKISEAEVEYKIEIDSIPVPVQASDEGVPPAENTDSKEESETKKEEEQ